MCSYVFHVFSYILYVSDVFLTVLVYVSYIVATVPTSF